MNAARARKWGFVVAMGVTLVASACGEWELKKIHHDEDSSTTPIYIPPMVIGSATPVPVDAQSQDCKEWTTWVGSSGQWAESATTRSYQCFSNNDYSWRTSCQSAECRTVTVFVHYMLDKDLGDSRTVQVEAFDNKYFQGAPRASVEITSFLAKQGEWKGANLLLEPGEYYVRAYIGTISEPRIPYVLGGMEVVSEQPFGVYGAMSQPQKISVAPQNQTQVVEPVHIMLDKLVSKPGEEPLTNARLRFSLTISDMTKMQPGRKVIISLLDVADPQALPVHSFELTSDMFYFPGREGKADLVTPALELGQYFVFAYVDLNGNALIDAGELQTIYKEGGEAKKIGLKEKYTQMVPLTL